MFPPETRVLVVEDTATMRKIIVDYFRQMGLTKVTDAEDGADAWYKIKTARKEGLPFELIVSDWEMPYMRGIDLVKKLRATPEEAYTAFVMMTSIAEKDAIVQAAKSSVNDYIMKPVRLDTLQQKLTAVYAKTAFANSLIIE